MPQVKLHFTFLQKSPTITNFLSCQDAERNGTTSECKFKFYVTLRFYFSSSSSTYKSYIFVSRWMSMNVIYFYKIYHITSEVIFVAFLLYSLLFFVHFSTYFFLPLFLSLSCVYITFISSDRRFFVSFCNITYYFFCSGRFCWNLMNCERDAVLLHFHLDIGFCCLKSVCFCVWRNFWYKTFPLYYKSPFSLVSSSSWSLLDVCLCVYMCFGLMSITFFCHQTLDVH